MVDIIYVNLHTQDSLPPIINLYTFASNTCLQCTVPQLSDRCTVRLRIYDDLLLTVTGTALRPPIREKMLQTIIYLLAMDSRARATIFRCWFVRKGRYARSRWSQWWQRARIGKGVRFQPGLSREVGEGRGLNTRWWLVYQGVVWCPGVCGVGCGVMCGVWCGMSGVFPYMVDGKRLQMEASSIEVGLARIGMVLKMRTGKAVSSD